MLKLLSLDELRPGMQVVDVGLDWKHHPYVYGKDMLISGEDIERIREEGYRQAYVDLTRSKANVLIEAMPKPEPHSTSEQQALRVTAPIEEELPKALKVHDESVRYARKFMTEVRMGKVVSMEAASPIVEDILASLERNADALISLSRLHHSDEYTFTHCVNVAVLSTYYARYIGKPSNEVFIAGLAGLFHDVGKARVPTQVLNAPRKLSEAEFAIMKQHPVIGYEQLSHVPDIHANVLRGALEHHEKYDGTGYPRGLKDAKISHTGAVVGISDVYDALTSKRIYKDPMFPHKALGIMFQLKDKSFNPDLISEFIRMVGIYPVGSVVVLEDGSRGVVLRSNPEKPTRPVVALVLTPNGAQTYKELDLDGQDAVAIQRSIPAEGSGVNPGKVLGLAP